MDNNQVNPNSVSRIAAGMSIVNGNVAATSDLRIDGEYEGKISSEGRVIIGETAQVTGEILCADLDIWGSFNGTINVRDTLSLKEGCHVKGELHAGKFEVEHGAHVDGVIRMG